MKTIYNSYEIATNGAILDINTTAILSAASVVGEKTESAINANEVKLLVQFDRNGSLGIEELTTDTAAATHYSVNGSNVKIQLSGITGRNRLTVRAMYGTECKAIYIIDVIAPTTMYYLYIDGANIMPLKRDKSKDQSGHGGHTFKAYTYEFGDKKVFFNVGDTAKDLLNKSRECYVTNYDGNWYDNPYSVGRVRAGIEDVTYTNIDAGNFGAVDTYTGNGGGGEGGISQYILTFSGNTFYHNGVAVDYAIIKAAIEDVSKFVYLDFANALHLPCFVVDAEGHGAVAFSAAFSIDGQPHIERVAINEANDVHIDNYAIVAYTDNNGVNLGTGANASGNYAVAEGNNTTASGNYSHAEGVNTKATKAGSHAEGAETTASGNYSHAEGYKTTASGVYAHAEGHSTTATAEDAHAEGHDTHATGTFAHAEGNGTRAGADTSHAEGYATSATANNAHAEGNNTLAQGVASHSEGIGSQALGDYSHVQNQDCVARGQASAAAGWRSIANTKSEFVVGEWNVQQAETPQQRGEYMFIGGNGTAEANRNAFAFGWDGSLSLFKSDGTAVKLTPELLESLLSLL